MAQNVIEYEPLVWMEESIPEDIDGKYKSTMTTILSKHCLAFSEEIIHSSIHTTHASKKKLKELITKHNNEIFAFMIHPDKIPSILHSAETIFRKYGKDAPTIKGYTTQQLLKDVNINISLEHVVAELNDGLKKLQGEGTLDDFMKQLRWIFHHYRAIGEEVIRLETILFQKIDTLDKLQYRVPLVTGLANNEALPELVDAFSKYVTQIYHTSQFEDTYIQLVEEYKKWNICRQLITLPNLVKQSAEPSCSICLSEPISSAIVPCGHTFCNNCSKKQNTTCYICRGVIRERIKLFFA